MRILIFLFSFFILSSAMASEHYAGYLAEWQGSEIGMMRLTWSIDETGRYETQAQLKNKGILRTLKSFLYNAASQGQMTRDTITSFFYDALEEKGDSKRPLFWKRDPKALQNFLITDSASPWVTRKICQMPVDPFGAFLWLGAQNWPRDTQHDLTLYDGRHFFTAHIKSLGKTNLKQEGRLYENLRAYRMNFTAIDGIKDKHLENWHGTTLTIFYNEANYLFMVEAQLPDSFARLTMVESQ